MDDLAEVLGGLPVGGRASLGVVLHEHLRTVTLALRHRGHVEARVE